MGKESFKSSFNKLTDKELIAVLKERQKYQKDAVDAVIDLAESRELQLENIKKEIFDERLDYEASEQKLNKKRELKIMKLTPKVVGIYQVLGGIFLILSSFFVSSVELNIEVV